MPLIGLIYHHYTKIENVDVRLEILESGDKVSLTINFIKLPGIVYGPSLKR